MDVALLIAGLVRTGIWVYGAYLAHERGSRSGVVAFVLIAVVAFFFAMSNAGVDVPRWMFIVNTYLSAPAAAMVVATYFLTPRTEPIRLPCSHDGHAET